MYLRVVVVRSTVEPPGGIRIFWASILTTRGVYANENRKRRLVLSRAASLESPNVTLVLRVLAWPDRFQAKGRQLGAGLYVTSMFPCIFSLLYCGSPSRHSSTKHKIGSNISDWGASIRRRITTKFVTAILTCAQRVNVLIQQESADLGMRW